MEKTLAFNNEDINNAMTIKLSDIPKDIPPFVKNIRRAPRREAKFLFMFCKLLIIYA